MGATLVTRTKQIHEIPLIELIRKDKIIVANSGDKLDAELEKRGLNPENVFFKHSRLVCESHESSTTHKHRVSPYLSDMLPMEFAMISALHMAAPENTVAPIALVVDKGHWRRNGVGYVMEHINGKRLSLSSEKDEIQKLISVTEKLHDAGLGHGDLQKHNAILTNAGTLKLIDPWVSLDGGEIHWGSAIRSDKEYLNGYKEELSKI